ncbi:MAG: glutathione S-transferase family protein [Aestuariivirga sp.]|nr:glutathione S-transferase family protein [Aestuariivirga sp.]
MSTPKVTYFDFAGSRGEEVRLALVIAGVAFDDNRISRDAFATIKPELPFGSLPIFEVAGKGTLAQTNAILRLIGRLYGLYPDDPWEAARHDAVLESCEDMRHRISATSQAAPGADRAAARQALAANVIPRWAKGLEQLIGKGPFVGGQRPAVADLKIYMIEKALSGGNFDDIPITVLEPFPGIKAVASGIAKHPAVVAWYASKT